MKKTIITYLSLGKYMFVFWKATGVYVGGGFVCGKVIKGALEVPNHSYMFVDR
jgi:hypothetical protein